jgi:CHAD domain-containing protein
VLEITGDCFGDEAKAARGAARELQQILGDIHDCDVMLPRVRHIDSLATLLRERRKLLFQRFRDLWQAERGKGTWTALERLLQEPA